MTLTKADIVEDVRDKVRQKKTKKERQQYLFPEFEYDILPQKRANALVEALFEIMKKALERGDRIHLTGFGQFLVRFKWARNGRDPQTGDPIILKSRRVVTFKCSRKLREKLNHLT